MFVNERKHCDGVAKLLNAEHLRCGVLHAGRSQDAREETLTMFRNGQLHVLIATDVAGRGLDIPDVEHVVNFNMATEISKYCHRIGRTGRAGKSGVATTFLTDNDEEVGSGRRPPRARARSLSSPFFAPRLHPPNQPPTLSPPSPAPNPSGLRSSTTSRRTSSRPARPCRRSSRRTRPPRPRPARATTAASSSTSRATRCSTRRSSRALREADDEAPFRGARAARAARERARGRD